MGEQKPFRSPSESIAGWCPGMSSALEFTWFGSGGQCLGMLPSRALFFSGYSPRNSSGSEDG
eukprot:11337931-Heterocapsa_arctica.AAC.1